MSLAQGTRSFARALGHYAIAPACYLVAVSLLGYRLLGRAPDPAVPAAIGLLAWAVYTLDRVKLADPWLDPADERADPLRQKRLAAHAKPLRVLALLAAAASLVLLAPHHPLLATMPPLALGFIWLYAGSPHSPRLKRSALVKTPFVACAIAGAGVGPPLLAALFTDAPIPPIRALALAFAALALVVAADVALCDIDHQPTDRAAGVRSVPATYGIPAAAGLAAFAIAVATALFVFLDAPWPVAAVLGLSTLPALMAERTQPPSRHRDWVEWRLVLAAALWIVF